MTISNNGDPACSRNVSTCGRFLYLQPVWYWNVSLITTLLQVKNKGKNVKIPSNLDAQEDDLIQWLKYREVECTDTELDLEVTFPAMVLGLSENTPDCELLYNYKLYWNRAN